MKYSLSLILAAASVLCAATHAAGPKPATTKWKQVAVEGQEFSVDGTRRVRIGVPWADVWVVETLTGSGVCSVGFFGVDPRRGNAKVCEVEVDEPAPTPAAPRAAAAPPATRALPTSAPVAVRTAAPDNPLVNVSQRSMGDDEVTIGRVSINTKLIPKPLQNPVGGWSTDMLVPTTELPSPSEVGAFRTGCQMAKMSFDDPIVFPGQPGRSHLHTFFGNTAVDAHSTAESIASKGNSTCRGGTINRSSYWVPSMIDTRTGAPLAPLLESNFYYKTGYALPANVITLMPAGLRMIVGNARGTPEAPSNAASYACVWEGGNGEWKKSIPTECPVVGVSYLIMGLDFPQCWDGVNLDSPDHRSHMADPVNVRGNGTGRCPASHPVALPQIAYQILYPINAPGDTRYWRLSSDDYDLNKPAGLSGHGDWFNGWKPEIAAIWVKNCDRAKKDCHSHLLGDGRAMVIP